LGCNRPKCILSVASSDFSVPKASGIENRGMTQPAMIGGTCGGTSGQYWQIILLFFRSFIHIAIPAASNITASGDFRIRAKSPDGASMENHIHSGKVVPPRRDPLLVTASPPDPGMTDTWLGQSRFHRPSDTASRSA